MIEFDIQAMSCGHCARSIDEAVKQLDPQARVEVDLASKKVKIESTRDRAALAEALSEAGYPPSP